MLGKKYLSESVDLNVLRTGVLNLITAPCGSGKTHLATHDLPRLVSEDCKMLYLIDTTIGKKRILKEPNMRYYDKAWFDNACGKYVIYFEKGIVVITYHQLGYILEKEPDFLNAFELILCDEIHNAIIFGNILNSGQINSAKIARMAIDTFIQKNTSTLVVGVTATPNIVNTKFECSINHIQVDDEVRQYEIFDRKSFRNIFNVVSKLDKNKTGLAYTTHIGQMKKIVEAAKSNGLNAIAIWSLGSKKDPMDSEQLALWQYIVDKEELMSQYDLVVINAACGTAINIRSKVDYMVINSQIEDTIVQARGRVRDDLDLLYYLDKNTTDKIAIEIPYAYIGVPLYDEEKLLLRKMFPIWNAKGDLTAWPTLKRNIIAAGYTVTTHEGKKNGKRKSYDLINI